MVSKAHVQPQSSEMRPNVHYIARREGMPRVKREDTEAGPAGGGSASHSYSLFPKWPKDTGKTQACHQLALQLFQPGPRLLSKSLA